MYFFKSLHAYLCILNNMTSVSCDLVPVTLKVVWAETPAVCFCVKYHPARTPEPHQGRADQAAGHLLTPPLEKTNALTMKHLSPSPSTPSCLGSFLLSFSQPLYLLFFSLLFPLNTSCFPGPALSHKAVSSLMFSCIILLPLCTSQVTRPVRETAQYQTIHPSDITLFSRLGISLLSSYHLSKSGYCGFFGGTS